MNRLRRSLLANIVLTPWLATVPRAALSAAPVRIVVPYAAGSPTDVGVRQLVDAMRRGSDQNYLVDNRAGAGGTIGSAEVARAKPDGNTLLATTGGHVTNPAFYAKLPFDTARDFVPIALLTSSSGFVLLVPAKSPYDTLEQLVTAARAKPGWLSYGSAGIGNTTHLVGAMFEKGLGLELLHVPYKGNALNDLVAGQVDMVFWGSAAGYQFVRSGQLKALAITGPQRHALLPDIPTLQERGFRDVEAPAWAGMFGPAGMPASLIDRLSRDIAKAQRDPAYVAQAEAAGHTIGSLSSVQFAAQVQRELAHYHKVLPALGLRME